MGLGCTKIDCCPKGCMLYYRKNSRKIITNCFICGMERYKIVTKKGIEKKIVVKKCGTFPSFLNIEDYTFQWALHLT